LNCCSLVDGLNGPFVHPQLLGVVTMVLTGGSKKHVLFTHFAYPVLQGVGAMVGVFVRTVGAPVLGLTEGAWVLGWAVG
jgi:hypothetical protein